MTPRAIFISRSFDQIGDQLQQFAANGGALFAHPLLKFEGITKESIPFSDVIFFSSIRAANFYFQDQGIPKVLYACAGKETARKLLEQYQIECAFVAEEAGNPTQAALSFKEWLKERTVLFPRSEQSLLSYASLIPTSQKTEQIVYRTLANPMVIPPCDYYVFSSPSNVSAFLEVNELPSNARCIAWGKSTEAAFSAHQIPIYHCLTEGSIQELDAFLKTHVFQSIEL